MDYIEDKLSISLLLPHSLHLLILWSSYLMLTTLLVDLGNTLTDFIQFSFDIFYLQEVAIRYALLNSYVFIILSNLNLDCP